MKRHKEDGELQGKAPGFYLYVSDFERDVQMLSLAAQGLWIRMMGWAHFCDNRGYLELPTHVPMTEADISSKVGKAKKEVQIALREMERVGLFSRDERGCIYNRRMVKDSRISKVRKAAAAARLLDAKRTTDGTFAGQDVPAKQDLCPPNHPPNLEQNTVLSSSSSISSSHISTKEGVCEFDYGSHFNEIWSIYPKKGRTKIIDCQRQYVEVVSPDPVRLHESLLSPLRSGGKWEESDLWHRGYVCSLFEYLRNRRDLEDPEPFSTSANGTSTGNRRIDAANAAKKILEELNFDDVEIANE